MRELVVRIRFLSPCLGNVRPTKVEVNRLKLPRDAAGRVAFMPSWHRSNFALAAKILGKHQDEVGKILWEAAVDGTPASQRFRRYWNERGRDRYTLHEAFLPDQVVAISCAVPSAITDDDMQKLMDMAGRFKGLSPFRPGDFGHFVTESVRQKYLTMLVATNVVEQREEKEEVSPMTTD